MTAIDIIKSSSVEVVPGIELLDGSDALIRDISGDLLGGVVEHDNMAVIPGMARLVLAQAYNWESQRLRPYLTLTDLVTGESRRWNMGIYIPSTPDVDSTSTPTVYHVEAFDKLSIFDTAYGATYRVASGANYLATIASLLSDFGESADGIARDAVSKTLPVDMVWPLDNKNTYLVIVNDLLDAIGYTRVYTTRDGTVAAEPVSVFSEAPIIFDYTTGDDTIITPDVKRTSNIYSVPNKWVFVNDDPAASLPFEGAGIYTVINQSNGTTSVDFRGRIVTKVEKVEVADQASLIAVGNSIIERDRQTHEEVIFVTSANPIHWHNDIITFDAPELGVSAGTRFLEAKWTHPLGTGSKVSRTLRRTVVV